MYMSYSPLVSLIYNDTTIVLILSQSSAQVDIVLSPPIIALDNCRSKVLTSEVGHFNIPVTLLPQDKAVRN